MDQFTRRIVGAGVHPGDVDGVSLCCLFNNAISTKGIPQQLSSDPLFRYHQWQTNLRILDIEEIKSVPYTPTSHPFIERLIGNRVGERFAGRFLDYLFFWNTHNLERKLETFRQYYNQYQVHQALNGQSPAFVSADAEHQYAQLGQYSWQSHCKGHFQTPMAA